MGYEQVLKAGYALSLVVTMWATALLLGAALTPRTIGRSLADRGIVARLVALDVIAVPLLMLAWVTLLVPDQASANGLLLVAFASAGPLGIKLAQIAAGDVALAIGAVILLEGANALVVPAWTALLIPTGGGTVIADIVRTLGLLIVAPLVLGGLIRTLAPALADWLRAPLRMLSDVGLVLVVGCAMLRYLPEVTHIVFAGPGIASALTVVSVLGLGWLMGGPLRATRITVGLVSAVRANAVALAVAATAFAATPRTEAAVVVFALYSIFIPTGVAVVLGRQQAGLPSTGAASVPAGSGDDVARTSG